MNIYVGNLNFSLSGDELKEIFEEYGEVASAKVITDKYTGRSKGFGFVEMPNDTEGETAIKNLNGVEIKGRNMTVNQSEERKGNFRKDFSRNNNNYRSNY
ncbi:MAG: RNA-binding protein [Bacteroidota bacterium]|nr:RNA-binding protein [Bacteroidota bacterium]